MKGKSSYSVIHILVLAVFSTASAFSAERMDMKKMIRTYLRASKQSRIRVQFTVIPLIFILIMFFSIIPVGRALNTDTPKLSVISKTLEADAGGPYSGDEGSRIIFDGAASHDPFPRTKIVSYECDLDGDGDIDLVFRFRIGDTVLRCEDTEGKLTGLLVDGTPFEGIDAVKMVSLGP